MFLDVNKIHTYYGKSHILSDVFIQVERGKTAALLGRNGVGKSTTLKSIIGITPPRKGSIRFKEIEITGMKPHMICRLGIGYVPQERRIFPNLTVRQNLLTGLKPDQKVDNPWSIERIYNHFPKLKERDNQKGRHLSGGEQQMLTIARTLMGNPEVILIDEPTEGLAPLLIEVLVEMMRDMKENGSAILLVEQNLDIALELAERVYVLSKGSIAFQGTREEFLGDEEVRKKYLEV